MNSTTGGGNTPPSEVKKPVFYTHVGGGTPVIPTNPSAWTGEPMHPSSRRGNPVVVPPGEGEYGCECGNGVFMVHVKHSFGEGPKGPGVFTASSEPVCTACGVGVYTRDRES